MPTEEGVLGPARIFTPAITGCADKVTNVIRQTMTHVLFNICSSLLNQVDKNSK
jgi:hypothetical protein